MDKKYFPIRTETACQLKWTWSTIFLHHGTTNSCHRVDTTPVTIDSFDQFHNTPKKIDDRKLMLDGKWPSGGCEYCMNIEQAGGSSDRMMHLKIPDLVPVELETDLTATKVTPRIIEVYLDNVCNMSCVYCWDGFSSRIQAENKKFGTFTSHGVTLKNQSTRHPEFHQLSKKFWEWMDKNYQELRRFHILGGEPFFQQQFETCLEFLETHANPHLEFNIVSNLKVSPAKLEQFIERIKKLVSQKRIRRFDLTCSIDCWGAESEYIRYGINMDEWTKNFRYVASQKWIVLNINQVITSLSIKAIKSLIEFINQCRREYNRDIGHYFATCVNRPGLYPGIFGRSYFDNDFNSILEVMPDITWQDKESRIYMQGIMKEVSSKDRNNSELVNLRVFLDEIDRRRNLNWRTTFPWLVEELENVV